MIDLSSGTVKALRHMTPGERIAFMDSPIPGAPVDPKGSNWFTRIGTMAWNFNTLRLANGSLFGEDPNAWGYIEAGYTPSADNYVLENEWIKDFYPQSWDSIQESTSTLSSARKINRIIENHSVNMTLQEGGLVGNIFAAIPAALFDPVNFIPFAGPLFKAGGMTRATAKLVKTRMALNSLENLVLTGVVEPLMRDHDLTRTSAHTTADMIGSMLLGGIMPGVGAVIKKGVNKAKIGTTKKILGGKTPEDFVELHADALSKSMNRQIAEDPEAAAVFDRIKNPKLIPMPSDFTKESTYLGRAMEEVKEGSSVILGIAKDNKFGKYLANWLVLNPTQRILTHPNDNVKSIGVMLLRNNLVREIGLGDSAVEEVLAVVQQRLTMSNKVLVDMKKKYNSKEVETTLEKKLPDDDLYRLVGDLYITGKRTIAEVDDTFRVSPSEESHGFEYQDPFLAIRNDPETVKTIEAMTAESRLTGKIIKEALDDAGFTTKQSDLLHIVKKTIDQTAHLPRFVNHERADLAVATDGTSLVIKGLEDGLEHGKQANLDLFGAIVREQDEAIALAERKLKGTTSRSVKREAEWEMAVAKERRDAAYDMLEDFSKTGDDWEKARLTTAQRLDHQYRRIDSQAHGGAVHTSSAKELMSRKVFIDDRFLAPLMEKNIIVIRKQMQTHLIPQIVMATKQIDNFEKFNLTLRLKNAAAHIEKLKKKLENADGENKEWNDLKLWGKAKDRAIDLADESDVTTQLRLIDTNRTEGDTGHQIKRPITQAEKDAGRSEIFETIEDINDWIHETVSSRERIRSEQDEALGDFQMSTWDIHHLDEAGMWIEGTRFLSLSYQRNAILYGDIYGVPSRELNYDTVLKGQDFTPVSAKGERIIYKPRGATATPTKPKASLPMTFVYGRGGALPAGKNVKSKNTFDAILAGERTATSRNPGQLENINIGDMITFTNGKGGEVNVIVTGKRKANTITPTEWARLEGYDTKSAKDNWTAGKRFSQYEQITYKKAEPGKESYALSEFSKKQASKIDWEYRINKKGKLYVHILSGATGKGSIKKVKTAKNSEGEVIKFEEETGREGTYLQIKDKFLWINPVEIKEKSLLAINKERVAGTRSDMVVSTEGGKTEIKSFDWDRTKLTPQAIKELNKLHDAIKQTNVPPIVPGKGEMVMFKERIKEHEARREALAKKRLGELNELIVKEIDDMKELMRGRGTDPSIENQSRAREMNDKTLKAYKKFKDKEATFSKLTDNLNGIAKDITIKTHKYSGWEHLAKDHIDNMKEGDSPSNFIGFSSTNSLFERRRLKYNPYRRLIIGADRIDRVVERKNYMSEYEYAMLRIERSRKNAAYFATDPAQVISEAKRNLEDPNQVGSKKEFEEVKKDITYIYNQLLNRNVWAGDQHGVQTAISILKNLNFMRYMGMVTIASLSDLGNAIGTLGMARYVRTMWTYLGTPDRKNLSHFSRLNDAFEVASLENRANKYGGLDFEQDVYDPITQQRVDTSPQGKLKTIDRWTNSDSKLMGAFNIGHMLNKWNGFQKRIVTLGVEDMVAELGIARWNGGGKPREISERDRGIAQSMGFGESDLIRIGQMHERFGGKKDSIFGREFYLAQSERWTDDLFAFNYQARIKGTVDSIIVTPGAGSNPKWTSNPYLNHFWQFKSFLSASFDMTFLPFVQRGVLYKDPNQAMQVLMTALLGSMSYAIYETMKGINPFENKKVTDDDGNVDEVHWSRVMLTQGMDRAGMFALLFEAQNTFERIFGFGFHSLLAGNLDTKYKARSAVDLVGGPTVGGVFSAIESLRTLKHPLEPTVGELSALRRMIPAQNLIWTKLLFDVAPSWIDTTLMGEGNYFAKGESPSGFKTIQQRMAGE